jgi:hypothetical protein
MLRVAARRFLVICFQLHFNEYWKAQCLQSPIFRSLVQIITRLTLNVNVHWTAVSLFTPTREETNEESEDSLLNY